MKIKILTLEHEANIYEQKTFSYDNQTSIQHILQNKVYTEYLHAMN